MPILPPPQPRERSEDRLMPCEHDTCSDATPQHSAFSFITVLQCILADGTFAWYQCENEQHWACSHDHAVGAAHACIDCHHAEEKLVTARDGVRLRLPKDETCAICGSAITPGHAWNMPVAYATPGKGYAAYTCGTDDRHFHPNHHWCCSLEHAKAAAKACIVEHLSEGKHG